jgi:hypothetical protein
MNAIDVLAERHRFFDGQPIADYLPIALPCYSLQADVLLLERRYLLPVEEYVLRSVREGLNTPLTVCLFLGLAQSYGLRLITSLSEEEYLSLTEDGHLFLRGKGTEALRAEGEEQLQERTMTVLWDPVSHGLVGHRVELATSKEMANEGRPKVIPKELRLPVASDFSATELQTLRVNQTGARRNQDSLESHDSVVKCFEVRRPTLRYRRGVLLIFAGNKGSPPVARVAIDSGIDGAYSAAFLKSSSPEPLGIDRSFYRRAGTLVVDQRIRKIGLAAGNESTYGDVLRKRSALRLSIEVLEGTEKPDTSAVQKLEARRKELSVLDTVLAQVPVRSMQPFEVSSAFDEFVSNAKRRVLLTSSLPHPMKYGALSLFLLEKALERGVEIEFYLAGRPAVEFLTSKGDRWKALKKLSELAASYENFRVGFLRDQSRTIFEFLVDDSRLVISNEPAIGPRPNEQLVRQHSGYAITGKLPVATYVGEFLRPEDLNVSEHFRYQRSTEHKPPAIYRKKKANK